MDLNTMLSKLADNIENAAQLAHDLKLSLRLQEFEPRAFEHGMCKVGGRSNKNKPWDGTVRICLGNGELLEYPAMEVPFDLWPKGMQDQYDAIPVNKRKVL